MTTKTMHTCDDCAKLLAALENARHVLHAYLNGHALSEEDMRDAVVMADEAIGAMRRGA